MPAIIQSLRSSFKLSNRFKKSKQDTPSCTVPLKFYETRSRVPFAPNETVSSSTTITTAATVHDDRMEVDQDIVEGYELVRRREEGLEGVNATGVLDMPRSDPRVVLQKAIIETLTDEKDKLNSELTDARRALEEEKRNMSRMLETLETQLTDIQEREAIARELDAKCKEMIESREGLKEELKRNAAKAEECNEAIWKQAQERIQGFRVDTEKARKEKKIALSEKGMAVKVARDRGVRVAELETQLETVKKLLFIRSEELKIAQRFMSTGDRLSVNDIAREVEELNEDIYQCAVIIADYIVEAGAAGELSVDADELGYKRLDEARGKVAKYFGGDLVQRLRADVLDGETLLFECLIQNILVRACEDIINRLWHGNSEANKFLEEVWAGVSEKYDSGIARSWLAMTHSQLKQRRLDNSAVLEDLAALLDVIGLGRSSRNAAKISATLRTKVIDLTKQAQRIKGMVFEDVLSVAVEPFLVDTDTSFDGMRMQNPYGSQGQSNQLVICSTGLGVMCGKQQSAREVVLKSKVLLLSSLDADPQAESGEEATPQA